jgi:Zn-dependent M28 family amino/carboxypeptidase
LDLDINRENVNIITVSEDAWIPVSRKPSSFVFNLTAPDPFIETVLKSVDPKRMHDYIVALANIHTRQSASSGAREAQDYLQRTYTSFGFNAYTHQYRTDWSSNVIAEIRGTQYPDEIVIVGAHYDSRGPDRASTTQRAPGADDNASGTSNLLEFATIIRQQNIKFARTLRLTSFSGEEQGLVGSRAYAQSIATKVPRDNVIAYLNGDMLGWRVPNQNIIMAMMTRFVDQTLVDNCNQITRTYVPSLALGISTGCCSDQQSFAENGFPAAGYFENPFGASSYPHYHQSTDLPQYINVEQLGLEGTAIMAAALTYAGAYRG